MAATLLFLEHKRLYALKQEVDDRPGTPLDRAVVVRHGRDLTIATAMKSVHDALTAAQTLERHGLDVEVLDLRTLRPLDLRTVLASVERTNRLLVVEEGPRTGGWAADVVPEMAEHALADIDDVWRLAMPDVPLAYSPPLRGRGLTGTGEDRPVGARARRRGSGMTHFREELTV